ncbi:PadR family transcriptional regulator [Halorubrum sp. Atlit-28R]|uniref:PadR family transcriptional regulator n=1 Tax=Halorubrum sp. Atlit-28R TaxID=2282129 RepID=UPI000EF291FB|nr:PadR family transcriptional regulator [Halorubrum sp. Atlit-28R]RLM50104.1 PadR family transcriptional regulator [Halorubrum sp. Atlit-28R]
MNGLSAFQRDILYIIEGKEDPHGLAIKTALEEYYQTEVNHGRLYPNLDQLVEKDYVSKGTYDERTNMYSLTEQGEDLLITRRKWENQQVSLPTADND